MFPANAAGIALVILRSCVAIELFLAVPFIGTNIPFAVKFALISFLALTVSLGAYTPVGCAACVLLQAGTFQLHGGFGDVACTVPIVLPVSLFLIGPGAYSFDAKRYGRKVIFAPRN